MQKETHSTKTPRQSHAHAHTHRTRKPFILERRGKSAIYSVRYWDGNRGRYTNYKSTGTPNITEARRLARQWLERREIPQTAALPPLPDKNSPRAAALVAAIVAARPGRFSDAEKLRIVEALKAEGVIKSATIPGTPDNIPLALFLSDFWDWEKSEYIREKQRAGQSIHKTHAEHGAFFVRKYWAPYFGNKRLGEVTRQDLRAFLSSLSRFNLAASTKNSIFKAGTTALRWAYAREYIPENIAPEKAFSLFAANDTKPRQIITREQFRALMLAEWANPRQKLAFFVSALSGMRAGEVLALRREDLEENKILVRHSFNRADGLKAPKNGEARTVHFPFPQVLETMKESANANPHKDGFIFWGRKPHQPMTRTGLLSGFRAALVKSGAMTAEEARGYVFHGLRHFFTAEMKSTGADARILQRQTGHKTLAMLEHYANHETARDVLEIVNRQRAIAAEVIQGETAPEAVEIFF